MHLNMLFQGPLYFAGYANPNLKKQSLWRWKIRFPKNGSIPDNCRRLFTKAMRFSKAPGWVYGFAGRSSGSIEELWRYEATIIFSS